MQDRDRPQPGRADPVPVIELRSGTDAALVLTEALSGWAAELELSLPDRLSSIAEIRRAQDVLFELATGCALLAG